MNKGFAISLRLVFNQLQLEYYLYFHIMARERSALNRPNDLPSKFSLKDREFSSRTLEATVGRGA